MTASSETQSALAESPQSIVLHVLCPSLPPPNRFTLHDISPSTTISTLKARIAQTIPSEPSPETQRLIYRGKPLTNDAVALNDVLESSNDTEYSIHLVLPPAPVPHASTSARAPAPMPRGASGNPAPQSPFSSNRFTPQHLPHGQEIRYRGPALPAVPHEAEIGLALRRNIEAIRRQIDMQERGGPLGGVAAGTAGATSHSTTSTTTTASFAQQPAWPHVTPGLSHPGHSSISSDFTMASGSSGTANVHSNLPEEVRLRLQILRNQIAFGEEQLNRGVAPPMDHIIRIRTQLFALLDDQYQNPRAERDGSIESLLTRVFNIYTRADQLRVSQARTMPTPVLSGPPNPAPGQAPLYLLSSPNGYQALVASPRGAETMQSSLDTLRAMHSPTGASAPRTGAPPEIHNANAVVMENIVRQAVLNQRIENNGQLSFTRNLRRMWLFVRLYFFCYMFSEPGTWSRVVYVTLAVLVSLLSETGIPQQLYRMLVAPVQRHLEGLVHFAPDEPTPAPPGTQSTGQGNVPTAQPTGMRHQLRRVERSLALFIASLVPGVGERHVEVRNAAEAARNAERAREEEERRRQEEEATNAGTTGEAQAQAQESSENEQRETGENAPNTIPQTEN
ncbi:hypothetical protein BDQ94DRAFT_148319 [Aspergillus welwitschiae]|uniref:Ubiquitin-like domain-containing protein n=1 Tax=Aspergillus welwitschiae TaxID=1341132 RepID=A0A3F3PUT0_9EURO|nr:hypothetical protein BDQ94DRAFT_148319 [Aspergillus welwitschiae]RDH30673.1 hypothetical protein BDQ94DRAFT_148319 [Aspergillus welwitschiae]GLA18473.1 hypothetical protein AnigIFM62618_006121 [Aspergillus niger]